MAETLKLILAVRRERTRCQKIGGGDIDQLVFIVGIRATLIMVGSFDDLLELEFPMLAKTPSSSPLINQETTTNTVPMTIFKLQTSSSHYPIALKTSQARQKKYSHKVIPPPLWIFFCKQKYLFREKHEFFVKFVSVKNRKNFTCFRTFPPPFP